MKLNVLKIASAALMSVSLMACAGSDKKAEMSNDDIADLTSVMGQEASELGDMPPVLGGESAPAPVAEVVTLDKPSIELNNGAKWAVDECYTFVVGGIQKAGRDYSISGNYDGNRFKKQLVDQVKKLKAECPDAGDSKDAIKAYFNPLVKYIKSLDSNAGVEESNKVVEYTKHYYDLFEMAE